MKLPDKFEYGRFKLESFYVYQFNVYATKIIINGIEAIVFEKGNSSEIYKKLTRGERIKVRLVTNADRKEYLIKIVDKDWVYIEKL